MPPKRVERQSRVAQVAPYGFALVCSLGLMAGIIVLSTQITSARRESQMQLDLANAAIEELQMTSGAINYTTTIIETGMATIDPDNGVNGDFQVTARLKKLVDETNRLRLFALEFDPPASPQPIGPSSATFNFEYDTSKLIPLHPTDTFATSLFSSELAKFSLTPIGNVVSYQLTDTSVPLVIEGAICTDVTCTAGPFGAVPATTITWSAPISIYLSANRVAEVP